MNFKIIHVSVFHDHINISFFVKGGGGGHVFFSQCKKFCMLEYNLQMYCNKYSIFTRICISINV